MLAVAVPARDAQAHAWANSNLRGPARERWLLGVVLASAAPSIARPFLDDPARVEHAVKHHAGGC
jgi:hypothetical protein